MFVATSQSVALGCWWRVGDLLVQESQLSRCQNLVYLAGSLPTGHKYGILCKEDMSYVIIDVIIINVIIYS
jgi:hypothetical protein